MYEPLSGFVFRLHKWGFELVITKQKLNVKAL
jgi:hypothetical protein